MVNKAKLRALRKGIGESIADVVKKIGVSGNMLLYIEQDMRYDQLPVRVQHGGRAEARHAFRPANPYPAIASTGGSRTRMCSALDETLSRYDWHDDARKFIDDEETIKETLAEFTEIVTGLLAGPNLAKALAEDAPVEKSGKKISGKNHQTLQTIHDSLGA